MRVARGVILVAALSLFTSLPPALAAPGWVEFADNPVLAPGPLGTWDDWDVYSVHVVHSAGGYRMWYTGDNRSTEKAQIGLANSSDGVTWRKYSGNPVVKVGASRRWDDDALRSPCVLYMGGQWKMWYTGSAVAGPWRFGYATSPDGTAWTKHASNPVLSPGSAGSWDYAIIYAPDVIYSAGLYHMWYTGGGSGNARSIGYATSPDGVAWRKHPNNPVLTVGPTGAWDSLQVVSPSVVVIDGVYHMWYQGGKTVGDSTRTAFGHATSTDGVRWTKDPANPVKAPGAAGTWDADRIYFPTVWRDCGALRMWFHGNATPNGTLYIGYAEQAGPLCSVEVPLVRKQ